MEKWSRTFLKRLEQELEPYREDCIFLEAEGSNPDTLRQMFDVGGEGANLAPVVTDIAVFSMEDGTELLHIYTEIAYDVDKGAVSRLLESVNEQNVKCPIGTFGYADTEGQLFHRYTMLVSEPEDMEALVETTIQTLDLSLGTIGLCYEELYGIAKEGK